MKLSEVLTVLLKAEDEAVEIRLDAERQAKALIEKARNAFSENQEARLKAAREEARAQVESARQAVEIDAQHVLALSKASCEKIQDHFDNKIPQLINQLADELATKYALQGRV